MLGRHRWVAETAAGWRVLRRVDHLPLGAKETSRWKNVRVGCRNRNVLTPVRSHRFTGSGIHMEMDHVTCLPLQFLQTGCD